MSVEDCYQELGVAPDASDAEVKAAWRRLAARWHPDRNHSPQALRKIQRLNQALEEIRQRRREAAGAAEEEVTPAQPAAPDPTEAPGEPGVRLHEALITVEEAAAGCVRELHGEIVEECVHCAGSSRALQPSACEACAGSGRSAQPMWFAWLSPSMTCNACAGAGEIRQACPACAGRGKAQPLGYRCRLDIPAGVRHGSVLPATARVQGRRQQPAVPLQVRVSILPHELFTLADDGTVGCELPVDGFAWMAERWVQVPTLRGLQQMRLRRGALSYRIKSAGLPWQDGGRCADGIVNVVPVFPPDLDAAQEALVEALVSSNTGRLGTDAAARAAAWQARIERWQTRVGA